MKKIILLAAFGVAGLVSAKNVEVEKEKVEATKTQKSQAAFSGMQCMQVGILVWCTDEVVTDSVCWGEGSGTATYEQAIKDERHNAALLNEFTCGSSNP